MPLDFFNKSKASALVFGAALSALVGKATVSAEEADAANEELKAAGITGAGLINEATFNDLSGKAGRAEAAETALAVAQKAQQAAEEKAADAQKAQKTAEDTSASLQASLDTANAKIKELGGQPGAEHTTPSKEGGASDVDEPSSEAEYQKQVDALHAKMLGE